MSSRFSSLASTPKQVSKSVASRGLYDGHFGVDRDLHNWWLALNKAAVKCGVPLRVVWGVRTKSQQNELKRKGFSRSSFPDSPHNRGAALDIIHMDHGWNDSFTDPMWGILGAFGKEIARQRGLSLEWGGDWGADWSASPPRRGWDPAHWQLVNWRDFEICR